MNPPFVTKSPPHRRFVRDEAGIRYYIGGRGGGPGDVKVDVKMKWGSLQISGASRSDKATAHANCFNCAALLRSGPLNRSGKKGKNASWLFGCCISTDRALPAPQSVSDRHAEVSPPAACVTSLHVQRRCSPRPLRPDLVFLRGIRTTRRGKIFASSRIRVRGLSPRRSEAGISSCLLIFDRYFFCVCE